MSCRTVSSKSGSEGSGSDAGSGVGTPCARPTWGKAAKSAMTVRTVHNRCRSMTASPDRLKHELEADDPAPEGCAVRYRITFRVFDMFPDAVYLEFHEAVQGPVDAERQRAIAGREDRLGAGVAERSVRAAGAVEPHPFIAHG